MTREVWPEELTPGLLWEGAGPLQRAAGWPSGLPGPSLLHQPPPAPSAQPPPHTHPQGPPVSTASPSPGLPGNSSPSTFWLLRLPVSGCWVAGKQLIKVINAAIKARKTEARVLAAGSPFSSPLHSPHLSVLPSASPPLPSSSIPSGLPLRLMQLRQSALANRSPHLGAGRLHTRGPISAAQNPPGHQGLGAPLDWGASGSDGVLPRRMVYAG